MIPKLFELINLNISQHAPTTLALPASNYVTNTSRRARKAAQVHVDEVLHAVLIQARLK
jgi:hypothetical protein